MKQTKTILILGVSLLVFSLHAQETSKFKLALEGGSQYVTGDLNTKWDVRQDVGYMNYGWDYDNNIGNGNSLNSEMTMQFIGIKPEFAFLNNMFAITSGIRYTQINSVLSMNSSSVGSYFFLREDISVNSTEFYKVKKINEDNDYLGIPLELTFMPFQYEYMAFYLKGGIEFNYKFNSDRTIQFLNADMNPYQQNLFNQAGVTSNPYYSTLYSAVGIRYGKGNGWKFNFELLFPSHILTTNNSSIVIPRFYSGVKVSVMLPQKKTTMVKSSTNSL